MNNDVFNELIVVKRSGQRVSFNTNKIALAIKNAFDSVSLYNQEKEINKVYGDVLEYISGIYEGRKTINVEDIQDIIETKLKDNKYDIVYESFSQYRIRRAASRRITDTKQQHKFIKAIERIANENRSENKETPNFILRDFGKTVACEFTKAYVLDNKFARAHEEGTIYIHNLDYFYLGSLSSTHLNYDAVLSNNNFPLNILCLATNAKDEIDGEISFAKIDYVLVDYVTRSYKEVLKEKLNWYLNIDGYLEYINAKKLKNMIDKDNNMPINFNKYEQFILNDQVKRLFDLANKDTLNSLNNKLKNEFYQLLLGLNTNYKENKKYSISLGTNNSYVGDLINKLFLMKLDTMDNLENVTVIFKVTSNNKLLDLVSKLISNNKNVSLSFINTSYNYDLNNEVEYFSNGKRIFENNISNVRSSIGRMLIASTSINLSRLGFKHQNKPVKELYNELDEILDLVKNELIMVFETIGDKYKDNYKIIFNQNIIDDEKLEFGQKIRKVIKNGVLNIELVGIKECVTNLEIDSEKRKDLVVTILKHINDKVGSFIDDTKFNFIISETSKYRPLKELMTLDKTIFGLVDDITDKTIYSRIDSMFLYKDNIKSDLKYLGKYQKLLTGGSLLKIGLPNNTSTKKIIELIEIIKESDVGFVRLESRRNGTYEN